MDTFVCDDPLQKGEVLKQEVDVRPGRLGHPGVIPGNALPNVAAPELRDGQGALGQDPLVLEPVHPCSRCDSALHLKPGVAVLHPFLVDNSRPLTETSDLFFFLQCINLFTSLVVTGLDNRSWTN